MGDMEVLNDPETSDWLRAALRAALDCDAVRVANDVEMLRSVLHRRVADQGRDLRFPEGWIPAA
jgi:hypothetical protein